MKKDMLFKIVPIIFLFITMIVFIVTNNVINGYEYYKYNEIYYIPLSIVEFINIIFCLNSFKTKKINKKQIVIYIIFLIIVFFIPIYYYAYFYAPTGPDSIWSGVAIKKNYLNIYMINIANLVNMF